MEKSHTCVEGGAHLRISVWHLLLNLKNNYLLKNWWSGPKKRCKILTLMLYFFKIEKHTLRYDFAHVYLKSWWYDLQFLRIRVWQTKIGNYGSVFFLLTTPPPCPAKNPKNQNFEKMRKLMEISFYTCVPKTTIIWDFQNFEKIKKAYEGVIILYMCTKNHNHMVYASWDMGTTHNFLSFWVNFCPFTPLLAPKIKNWKNENKKPRTYYHYISYFTCAE